MGHGAELSGCGKFMKYIMFLVNLIILIGGAAVLGIGIWALIDISNMEAFVGSTVYKSSSIILIATGSVTVLLSFFGCCGAVKEVKCMLLIYFIITLAIFLTMLIGGILGFVFRDDVTNSLRNEMTESIRDYGGNHSQVTTDTWDFTQEKLKCCGVEGADGYKIWMQENVLFQGENKVPHTCCRKNPDGSFMDCQSNPNNSTAYLNGCLNSAAQMLKDQAEVLGGVAIGIACVMIFGMIFSMALFKRIK